jgi:hypothetical protein
MSREDADYLLAKMDRLSTADAGVDESQAA